MDLLKEKYGTNNQSEAIRLAISECLLSEDTEKLKHYFLYGKKPPRIGTLLIKNVRKYDFAFKKKKVLISGVDEVEKILGIWLVLRKFGNYEAVDGTVTLYQEFIQG